MTTILITGAAGFLGSHLVNDLITSGNNIIGIDNLSTGRMENLKDVYNHSNFIFIKEDVSNPSLLKMEILKDVKEIYHLASPASPKFYQAEPFKTIEVNTIGTENMLKLAKRNDAKIVYTSTSEAYGDPEIHPQHESYRGNVNTWGPRACYDEAKRLGEVYCYLYHVHHRVKVKVARIFNTYSAGLRNDDGRVISNFVTQALTGENITVYGDGTQTRSFCYVTDTIDALKRLMEKDEANGEIINIGNDKEYQILEVARMVKKLTKSKGNITFHPLPKDDPMKRRPLIEKAKNILGWEPIINLEEGLILSISKYKKTLFPPFN